ADQTPGVPIDGDPIALAQIALEADQGVHVGDDPADFGPLVEATTGVGEKLFEGERSRSGDARGPVLEHRETAAVHAELVDGLHGQLPEQRSHGLTLRGLGPLDVETSSSSPRVVARVIPPCSKKTRPFTPSPRTSTMPRWLARLRSRR